MSRTAIDDGTAVEFGADQFHAAAKSYADAKRIIDAASSYDSVDDAVAALRSAWEKLESMAAEGQGYTPPTELGFGSNSASVIAESLLGRRATVGTIRKLMAGIGKGK